MVVVTYNSGEHLPAFLASVPLATDGPVSIVVSDNGSVDGSLDELERTSPPTIRMLRNPGNLGYGAAANRGAAGATEDWVLVANPDVVMTPGVIDLLIDAAARWPEAGSLGPGILTPDGELYPSARMLPSLGRGVGHALFGWVWPTNPWSTAYRNDRGTPTEGPVGWLSGSFLLLRRSAFEQIAGFDEGYFMYFEDVDLGDRLGRAGYANVYVPSATVLHVGGHSTTKDPASADIMARAHHRSAYRYLAGRHTGPVWAPVRAAVKGGLGARYLLSRIVGRVSHTAVPTRAMATEVPNGDTGERPDQGKAN